MNGSSAFSGGSVVAAEVSDGVVVVSDGAVGVVSYGAVVGITVPRFTSSLHTVQYSSPV